MSDKKVSMLPRVDEVSPKALLVCEQDGQAMAILGQVLINMLLKFADGHGGISNWDIVPGPGPLDFTLKLTLAKSGSVIEVPMHNGKGITSITKLRSEGTEATGIVDVYQVLYNDTTTQELRLRNGKTGKTGAQTYVHIKYASVDPASPPHSMGDIPDSWMGVYVGLKAEPPALWSEYEWYERKGEKGDTGAPATLQSATTEYQVGTSGTVMPSGEWLKEVPSTPQGRWLWTRTTYRFNSGDPAVTYGVSYVGRDGSGDVGSVCGVSPGLDGNVDLNDYLNTFNLEKNHPIDSIYTTFSKNDFPAARYGGEWSLIEQGLVLLSAGQDYAAGQKYGSAEHGHDVSGYAKVGFVPGGGGYNGQVAVQLIKTPKIVPINTALSGSQPTEYHSGFNTDKFAEALGTADKASNLQPSIAIFIWRRTA